MRQTLGLVIFALTSLAAPQDILAQQAVTFAWKDPVSGGFTTAANWDTTEPSLRQNPASPTDFTANVPPRAGDFILFRDGTYTVNMAGAPAVRLVNFGLGQEPRSDHFDVTLALSGDFMTDEFFGADAVTVTGSGSMIAGLFQSLGHFVVRGATARLGRTLRLSLSPPNPDRELLVIEGGTLVTTDAAHFWGVTVDNGTWEHTGPAAPFGDPNITLLNGATFRSDAVDIRVLSTLRAENGSTVDIKEFNRDLPLPGVQVQIGSGAKMINQNATAGSSPNDQSTFVDGAGSEWRVAGTFTVSPAGGVTLRNQGRMTADVAAFDDFAFGTITATNEGSVLALRRVIGGNAIVSARGGAQVTIESAELSGSGSSLASDGVSSGGTNSRFISTGLISGRGNIAASRGGSFSAADVVLTGSRADAAGMNARLHVANTLTLNEARFSVSEGAALEAVYATVRGGGNGFGGASVEGMNSTATFDTLLFGEGPGTISATLQAGGRLVIRENGTNWIGSAAGSDARVMIASSALVDASYANELVVGKNGIGSVTVSGGRLVFGQPGSGDDPLPGPGSENTDCLPVPSGPGVPESPKFVIGSETGSRGTLALNGADSSAEVNGQRFYIGEKSGEGALIVRNGAQLKVTVPLMTLGKESGARGTLTLEGPGSRIEGIQSGAGVVGTRLEIGRFGEGIVQILNGASFKLPSTILGCFEDSVGTVRVIGRGDNEPSRFESDGSITIGSRARGTLEIASGGRMASYNDVVIGRFGTGEGLVTLRGGDSQWTHTATKGGTPAGNVVVGMAGKGTLVVGDQARFDTGELIVGDRGEGEQRAEGTMIITNGAVVTAHGAFVSLGKEVAGKGTLILDGPESRLQGIKDQNDGAGATLEIGRHGEGTLILTNGASIRLPSMILASQSGANGAIQVGGRSATGSEAMLEIDGSFTIGGVSTGLVAVTAGGRVLSHGSAVIGRSSAADGRVTLKEEGAVWSHSNEAGGEQPGRVVVGESGSGRLEVFGGASMRTGPMIVGQEPSERGGNVVIIRGGDEGEVSRLSSQGRVVIGQRGLGVMRLERDAVFSHRRDPNEQIDNLVLGDEQDAEGRLEILEPNARLESDWTVEVGVEGKGQIWMASSTRGDTTAFFNSKNLRIGAGSGGEGIVEVDGPASRLETEFLQVGRAADSPSSSSGTAKGVLSISDGGTVRLKGGVPGEVLAVESPPDKTSQIVINGPNSKLDAPDRVLHLAGSNSEEVSALAINNGGQATVAAAVIGSGSGDTTVSLLGNEAARSEWTLQGSVENTNPLTIGDSAPGRLRVGERSLVRIQGPGAVHVGGSHAGMVEVRGEGARIEALENPFQVSGPAGSGIIVDDNGQIHAGELLVTGGSEVRIANKGIIQGTRKVEISRGLTTVGEGRLHAGIPSLETHSPSSVIVSSQNPGGAAFQLILREAGFLSVQGSLIMQSRAGITIDPSPGGLKPGLSGFFAVLLMDRGSAVIGSEPADFQPSTICVTRGGLLGGVGLIVGSGILGPVHVVVKPGGAIGLIPERVRLGPESPLSSRNPSNPIRKAGPEDEVYYATLFIDGDVTFEPDSILSVQIDGPGALDGYGVLEATGRVEAGGRLNLVFSEGFAPERGQTFDFLRTGESLTGSFQEVTVEGLAPGFQYELVHVSGEGLRLVALNDGVPASPPRLSIQRLGSELELSWPDWVEGYSLQSTTNLANDLWIDHVTTGNRLSLPSGQSRQFFRLIRP